MAAVAAAAAGPLHIKLVLLHLDRKVIMVPPPQAQLHAAAEAAQVVRVRFPVADSAQRALLLPPFHRLLTVVAVAGPPAAQVLLPPPTQETVAEAATLLLSAAPAAAAS